MPLIQVSMRAGRTRQQKQQLIQLLTEAMVKGAGARRERVTVIIYEVEAENWATDGKSLADDQDVQC